MASRVLIPIASLAALAALAIGLLFGHSTGTAADAIQPPPGLPVAVGPVIQAPGAGDIRATGRIRAVHEAKFAFKITGLVKTIHVDVGDKVTKGQVLAELDAKEINSQTIQARANVDKAKRDVDRARELVKTGVAPQQRLDDAKTALDVAQGALDAVTFNQSLARITAVEDGVVLARSGEVGEIVAAGAPVLTLGDLSGNYLARTGLSDRDIARVSLGDRALVTLDGVAGGPIAGRVTRLAAMSDPRTGTFDADITLDHRPAGLASGQVADIALTPSRRNAASDHVAVPVEAILEGHGADAFVYVLDQKAMTALRRRVRIGAIKGNAITVLNGVSLGEQVITQGAAYLRDGDRVQVVGPNGNQK